MELTDMTLEELRLFADLDEVMPIVPDTESKWNVAMSLAIKGLAKRDSRSAGTLASLKLGFTLTRDGSALREKEDRRNPNSWFPK